MTRPKRIAVISVSLLLVVLIAGIPLFLRARTAAQQNACLNNLRQIDSGSMSYCLAANISYGHTFTSKEFKERVCQYIKGGKPPVCPVCNLPCDPTPYSVYEGIRCPCGQRLPECQQEPWDGDFRGYLAALQQDFGFVGMRMGSGALLRLTPEMFNSVVVSNVILSGLEQWYTNPWDADLVACAATALGHIKDKRAVATLVEGLKCEEWYARKKIADALGEIGDTSAIEPLKSLAEDRDERVRKAATEAVKKLSAVKEQM